MIVPLSRPIIGDAERAAVDRVLRSGMLTGGPEGRAFEEEFAAFAGTHYAVAVGSGTAALHVSLLALGVGPGDEVIVPSFTFAATANVVRLCGATPVFVDVDPATYCMLPSEVEGAVSGRTVAIMPVHLFGHPADLLSLEGIAKRYGLAMVEDAAQAHGATYCGQTVGSWGTLGAFSFYPTKNMTTGEGGMITTNDSGLAESARVIRNQGMSARYRHEVVGLNERMTELEAAIGRVQLRRLPGWTQARQRNAAFYDSALKPSIGLPVVTEDASHVYHQYTVRLRERERVTRSLEEAGIGYGIYYPTPTHLQPPYRESAPHLPITERLADEVLSIPVRPDLTRQELGHIADTLNEVVDK